MLSVDVIIEYTKDMENSLSTNENVVESIKIRWLAFHPNTLMCIPKFHLYLAMFVLTVVEH